mmetsp:Transcript_16374/g.53325  ORF Transcript_16374/g.53325 Transcript_16374/m.53325 type:complete len:227 (+) Transcript_16374:524-1204(+)
MLARAHSCLRQLLRHKRLDARRSQGGEGILADPLVALRRLAFGWEERPRAVQKVDHRKPVSGHHRRPGVVRMGARDATAHPQAARQAAPVCDGLEQYGPGAGSATLQLPHGHRARANALPQCGRLGGGVKRLVPLVADAPAHRPADQPRQGRGGSIVRGRAVNVRLRLRHQRRERFVLIRDDQHVGSVGVRRQRPHRLHVPIRSIGRHHAARLTQAHTDGDFGGEP